MRVAALALALMVAGGACAGEEAELADPGGAGEYAASARRALQGTAYEADGDELVIELLGVMCDGLGSGTAAALVENRPAPAADQAILLEVLVTGVDQVCPLRAIPELAEVFRDAVTAATGGSGGGEAPAFIAAAAACRSLASGEGAAEALLAVVSELHGVDTDDVADLGDRLDPDQGIEAGAVLAAAAALACPAHIAEVESFMGSL